MLSWFEQRKFFMAQRIYREKWLDVPVPHPEKSEHFGETWESWFGRMFGEPLREYAERAKREGIRAKIDGAQEAA